MSDDLPDHDDQRLPGPIPRQAKKKEPTQKKTWMLTYCPAGTYITIEMLREHGIIADECHSTSDRVMNYTYIHLDKRCRITPIEKFFTNARDKYGIVKKEVFGYDSIGSKSAEPGAAKMQDHIVFKMLLAHSKEKNPSFSPCTDGESILKRGHLFEAHELIGDSAVALENQTKTQVINYARNLEEKVKNVDVIKREFQTMTNMYLEACRQRCDLRLENDDLRHEMEILKKKLQELEG